MPLRSRIFGEVFLVFVGLLYISLGVHAMYVLAMDPRISFACKATFLPIFSSLPMSGGVICHTLVGAWRGSWRERRARRRLSGVFE